MTRRTDDRDYRLSRVENDVAAIYDLLTDVHRVQSAHGAELALFHTKFDEHSTVLAEHSTVLADYSAVLARQDEDLASIKSTVAKVDRAVIEILRRLPEAG